MIGGARGIGAAIVRRLGAAGARCHVSSRRPVGGGPSAGVTSSIADVRSLEDIRGLVAAAAEAMDGLDALVYCAGTAAVGPFEAMTEQDWSAVHDVNLRGYAFSIQAALPYLRSAPDGAVVGLSSQAARRGQALIGAYTASKAGMEGLTRALAVELAPQVRVNAVAPGIVRTAMIVEDFERQAALSGKSEREVEERTRRRIPSGRFQTPESVAAAVTFLLSSEAADITGAIVGVDGGMTA